MEKQQHRENENQPGNQKQNEDQKQSLNVLHRDPDALTAGGPDRDPASGEESAEGKLRGVAEPSADHGKQKSAGALSGLNEGETWENDSSNRKKAAPGASPEEQKDQQTR